MKKLTRITLEEYQKICKDSNATISESSVGTIFDVRSEDFKQLIAENSPNKQADAYLLGVGMNVDVVGSDIYSIYPVRYITYQKENK